MPRWRWLVAGLASKIWFRAAVISLLSIGLALLSAWIAPLIPYSLSLKIGSEAADDILTILASSMLAVTTFSIAAMVTAFNGAARNVTPRASQLLIEDRTAQNALSTFLGSFLFAIVGIIALSTGIYGAEGRAVLFVGTIIVIAIISLTLLRWIQKLTGFGRMEDIMERVEHAATKAIERHKGPILLAGDGKPDASEGSCAVMAEKTGYVTFIDRETLVEQAKESGAQVTIAAAVGQFVDARVPLAWTSGEVADECVGAIRKSFSIGRQRDFGHDPRFGMVVLSEIASRALSPAVNDPGTAIAVLGSGQRVVEALVERSSGDKEEEQEPGVVESPLALEDMVSALVLPVARDGAGSAEVATRLHETLGSLAELVPEARDFLAGIAEEALERTRRSDIGPHDLRRVTEARRRAFRQS